MPKTATINVGIVLPTVTGTGEIKRSKTGRYLHTVLGILGLPPESKQRQEAKRYIVERFLGTFIHGTCTSHDRKLYLNDLCISYDIMIGSYAYKALKAATFDLVKHFKDGKTNEDC